MEFSHWLTVNEAKTEKVIVYHGTSPKNLGSIMSQGLIPDPPKRAWDDDKNTSFYSSSRKSLDGVYVTQNLLTATSAAGNGKNNLRDGCLLVVCEIQPKTAFMDEDDLNSFSSVSDSEYVIAALYGAIISGKKDELVEQFFQKFVEKFKRKFSDVKGMDNEELMTRVNPLLRQLFYKCVIRQAAYIDKWTFQKAKNYTKRAVMPDKHRAEMDFLRVKELLSKTLKKYANPHNHAEDKFNFVSRITQPIRFSGANRIICVVMIPYDHKRQPEVIYGIPPEKLITDWKLRIGEWNPAYRSEPG